MKFSFGGLTYAIRPECLEHLQSRRQKSRFAKETGGQLFGSFNGSTVDVQVATDTKGKSKRSRFAFWPDRQAERVEIEAFFAKGMHYLGDWHTHPEGKPTPSGPDVQKMVDIFRQSRHELQAMLLVIVGLDEFPDGLFVGAVTDKKVTRIFQESEEA